MLVFSNMDPTNFFLEKFDPRGPPTFKMEMKQQEPGRKKFQCHGGSKDLQKAPPSAASTL